MKLLLILIIFLTGSYISNIAIADQSCEDYLTSSAPKLTLISEFVEVPYGDLQAQSIEFDAFVEAVMSVQDPKLIPNLNLLEFSDFRNTSTGEVNGRQLFFKKGFPSQLLYEAKMSLILNRLGVGAKVAGVIQDGDELILATEFVPGQLVRANRSRRVFYLSDIKQSHLDDVHKTISTLLEAGFVNAYDLQFIFSPSGRAVLIDPELFAFRDYPSFSDHHAPPETVALELIENLESILRGNRLVPGIIE